MTVAHDKRWYFVLLIIAAALAIYILPLGSYRLLEPDEGRYSEIPREMIESGNYITPMLNHVKYFEKPAMLYWMNAASFKLFGQNEFAARFPSALCALLGALATGMLASFMFKSRKAGAIASSALTFSLLYFGVGTINITDMPLAFFMTLTMASFYAGHISRDKRWYLLFYLSMALGLLTKGLIAIVLPAGIIFWYIVFTRKWKLFLEALYIPGIILFFAAAVPWFYLVCRANPDFFYFFFIREHFLRYATMISDRYEPFWFFLPLIPAGVMPWTGFLFALFSRESVVRSPEDASQKDAVIYLLSWFIVILLFFSLSDSKLVPYITPCMPPLAILIGADIARMAERKRWHGACLWTTLAITLAFSIALAVVAMRGKYIGVHASMILAFKISFGLIIATAGMIWFTRGGKKNFTASAVAICLGAALFTAGTGGIHSIMSKTRSSYAESAVIMKEMKPDDTIAVYGEVLQGIPFYTKRRVMLVDYKGELEFGASHKEGEGWFPTGEEFLSEWNKRKKSFILVIEKDRIGRLFPNGATTGASKEIDTDKYKILFNRPEAK